MTQDELHAAAVAAFLDRLRSDPRSTDVLSDRVYAEGQVPDGAGLPHCVVGRGRFWAYPPTRPATLSLACVTVTVLAAEPAAIRDVVAAVRRVLVGFRSPPLRDIAALLTPGKATAADGDVVRLTDTFVAPVRPAATAAA